MKFPLLPLIYPGLKRLVPAFRLYVSIHLLLSPQWHQDIARWKQQVEDDGWSHGHVTVDWEPYDIWPSDPSASYGGPLLVNRKTKRWVIFMTNCNQAPTANWLARHAKEEEEPCDSSSA